ncbi:hypothetical protein GOV12_07415 [Candidatus Pacearchaeota archaeon]|nr:hypothetical protein [Candidatus Pacearchaeota archaeon]
MATLKTKKRIILIGMLFLLSINLIYAAPPSIPSLVYGKIIDGNNIPLPGEKVTAIWTNNDGELKAVTQLTQGGDNPGFYRFKDIDAQDGSKIQIQSEGITISVTATSGIPIKASDIIISNEEKKGFFKNILEFLFGEGKDTKGTGELEYDVDPNPEDKKDKTEKLEEIEKIKDAITLDSNDNKSASNNSNNISKENVIENQLNLDDPNYEDYSKSQKEPIEIEYEEEPIIIIEDKPPIIIENELSNTDAGTKNLHAPILDIPDIIYACENESLSYKFNVIDVNQGSLDYYIFPNYPDSPFFIKQVSKNSKEYVFEIFSQILTKQDIGKINIGSRTYNQRISVSDGKFADEKDVLIVIIEKNNPPNIINIGSKTIETGNNFYHKINVIDVEDKNEKISDFKYKITNDDSGLLEMSSEGVINTFNEMNIEGNYNVRFCVSDKGLKYPHEKITECNEDGKPKSSCDEFTITVTPDNNPPVIRGMRPSDLIFEIDQGEEIHLTLSKEDKDKSIPDTYWYLDNALISYQEGKSFSQLKYQVPCNISGIYKIKGEITDGLSNDSVTWNIDIKNNPNCKLNLETQCNEKKGCSYWKECSSIQEIKNADEKILIREKCIENAWSDQKCGYQKRFCIDINDCNFNEINNEEIRECHFSKNPRCNDDIKNCHDDFCEVLKDCGGNCDPCETCTDNIINQNEKDIDCGGSCPKCPETKRGLLSINTKIFNKIIVIFFITFLFITILLIITLSAKIFMMRKKVTKIDSFKIKPHYDSNINFDNEKNDETKI